MAPDEYLERIFGDAFRRELDADENVARTLPFFTATLALAASLFGYVTTKMPMLGPNTLSVSLYALLALGALGLAGVLWTLFEAVRAREYRLLPRETEQREWVEQLRTFFAGNGLSGQALDERVSGELRSRMVLEYAEASEHNRGNNRRKLAARAQGLTLLVAVLTIAFLMVAIMFASTVRFSSAQPGGSNAAASDSEKAGDGHARQPPAGAAAAPVLRGGGEVPGCACRGQGEAVTDTPKPPAAAPAPSQPANTAAAPPAPP